MAGPNKPSVSVIMRTKNSDWVVEESLRGLFSQTFDDFELLVVDSGSTDRTLEIVRKFPCRLIEIEAKSYYPGAVLNMAMNEVEGDIVVFQNSDVIPVGNDMLQHLLAAFDDPETYAAFGRQLPRPEALPWVRHDYARSFPDAGASPPWMPLSLALAAMRKSAWAKKPFYTTAWASEDTEWGHWARRQGMKIKYVPQAAAVHSHNYTLPQLYGRRFVEGEADVFIYGEVATVWAMLARTLKSTLADGFYHLCHGELRDLLDVPLRRFVYHLAYYKGHKFGERRLRSGGDGHFGQAVVLSTYRSR